MAIEKLRAAEKGRPRPYIPSLRLNGHQLTSSNLNASAAEADCVVIVTNHKAIVLVGLVDFAKLIFDTRIALKGIHSSKIVRL